MFLLSVPEIHSICQFVEDVKTKSRPRGLVVHVLFHGERFGLKYEKRFTISSDLLNASRFYVETMIKWLGNLNIPVCILS